MKSYLRSVIMKHNSYNAGSMRREIKIDKNILLADSAIPWPILLSVLFLDHIVISS